MTQRMKATKPIEYRGRSIKPGEVFPVKPEDIGTFNVQQSAVLTNETETKTPKRRYTRQATKAPAPKARAATRQAKPAAKTGAKVAPQTRRYNRRDMRAK